MPAPSGPIRRAARPYGGGRPYRSWCCSVASLAQGHVGRLHRLTFILFLGFHGRATGKTELGTCDEDIERSCHSLALFMDLNHEPLAATCFDAVRSASCGRYSWNSYTSRGRGSPSRWACMSPSSLCRWHPNYSSEAPPVRSIAKVQRARPSWTRSALPAVQMPHTS